MEDKRTDITIIGAGPVGLFSIFEAGMMRLRCHIIDSLDYVGGQCKALYPEKPIFDIPGFPIIRADELIKKLQEQVEPFNPTYHLGQKVVEIKKVEDYCLVTTNLGIRISSKVILIAAGAGFFGPNKPPLDGLEDFEGKSIFYKITDIESFRGKRIAIIGGGDSAVDWAITLSSLAKCIYFVHRRSKFRASPESVARLVTLASKKKDIIRLMVPYYLENLYGSSGKITHILIRSHVEKYKVIKIDALLLFFGLSTNLGPISQWNLNLEKDKVVVNPETMETSIENIFAIGDIASYPGKLKLILVGFSESAIAIHRIRKIIYPHDPILFQYSTTQGIPNIGLSR